jgi:hypothetical protein
MPRWCLFIFALVWVGTAKAQVPGPDLPTKYRAIVRYRIQAPRDIHVAHYDAMIEHLKSLNFEFDPPLEDHPDTDREDPNKNQIVGMVPGKNAVKILQNPSVATILLVPEEFKLPDQPEQQVHLRLELASGFPADRQRELGDQVRVILGLLGFKEAQGYDYHGYSKKPFTRIVGAIPAGQLDLLLRDLRYQPTNWLSTLVDLQELPSPFRQVNPILIVEVLPDPEPLREVVLAPRSPFYLEKLSADLWTLVEKKDQDNQVVRLQLVLIGTPSPEDKDLRFNLQQAAPSLLIDGWLGQVITGSATVGHAARLASLPEVSAVQLTRAVKVDVNPAIKVASDNAKALELSGLAKLHKEGFQGNKIRLAILDNDFRGWEKMVQEKKLPAGTKYVDLTGERDPDLLPAPLPGNPEGIGHGTQCALAAMLAAPKVELILVRIEGTDPYQVYELVHYFQGGKLSESLRRRQDEIIADRFSLLNQRDLLLKERKKILEDFTDESEIERNFGFLGPVMGWIFSDRQLHYQRMQYQSRLEKAMGERYDRFLQMAAKVEELKGMQLVANSLNWQDGYPVGGASTLSRWFHQQSRGKLLWFQAAGNTRGQAWAGLFRDADGNGVMEFAARETPSKPGRWTPEINFLGWQLHEGEMTPELPLQARVRLSVQWREPHDRDYYTRLGEDDFYLEPLAELQVQVLRQRDPEMKTLPADAFELVGRSSRLPMRLEHQPGHSIYEHSVEFTVDKASRYAVRLERQLPTRWLLREDPISQRLGFVFLRDLVPTGLRPRGVATLTALEKNWELRVRVFVEVLDEATRPLGRVLLLDHATDQGSLGLPADAKGVLTVGAVDLSGKPFPSSAAGPPAFQDLGGKPDLLAYAALQVVPEGSASAYGTSLAASFAAGWAAAVLSSGMSPDHLKEAIRQQGGKVMRIPERKKAVP